MVTTVFAFTFLSSLFLGSKLSLLNWFKIQDLPSSPFCFACNTSLPSAALPGTALCIFLPHQLFIFANGIRKSLPPPCPSPSPLLLSGDINAFTRQCFHTTVSGNYSHFPPTVLAYLTVKCLEEGQGGKKTQHRLRSSSVMLTSKKGKPIFTSATAH